jgi:protein-S-isoprenylcysteine O-methyltransferase Ste14
MIFINKIVNSIKNKYSAYQLNKEENNIIILNKIFFIIALVFSAWYPNVVYNSFSEVIPNFILLDWIGVLTLYMAGLILIIPYWLILINFQNASLARASRNIH